MAGLVPAIHVFTLLETGVDARDERGHAYARGCPMDAQTRIELEPAVYRPLVDHLRPRPDAPTNPRATLAGLSRTRPSTEVSRPS